MKKLNYISSVKFLFKYIYPYRKNFIRFYIGWFFDALLTIIMPILLGIMVDSIVYQQNIELFLRISLIFVIMSVFSCILYFLIYAQHQYLMSMYVFSIQKDIFHQIHNMKASVLSDSKSGDLVTLVQQHTRECMLFVIRNVIHLINHIMTIILITIYLFIINPWIGAFILFAAPVIVVINTKYGNKIREYSNTERAYYGTYAGYIFEVFTAVKDLRLLCAEDKVYNKFNNYQKDIFKVKEKSALSAVTAQNIMNGAKLIVQMSIFTLSAYFVSQGSMTIGLLSVVISYFTLLSGAMKWLSESYLDAQNRVGYIQRLYDVMNSPTESSWPGKDSLSVNEGNVVFESINFAYENENNVLDNFHLEIKNGEKIALCGESGCGKTTVSYLLAGFYDNYSGNIYIDGQNIKDCSLKSLRQNIGIVSQDVLLFPGTIKENLLLGKQKATTEELRSALEKAGIWDFIESLPDGLDTAIGSMGSGLSGGQKQRIAIARVYLKNPKIIIFDEATSALDDETEKQIHNEWNNVLKGRTAIVIAHRLSSVLLCDKAYIMENGHITAQGNPEELKNTSELFSHLFALKEAEVIV